MNVVTSAPDDVGEHDVGEVERAGAVVPGLSIPSDDEREGAADGIFDDFHQEEVVRRRYRR